MDESSSAPEPVVIEQDEGSEIHLQVAAQSGPRQLDIRVWKRGPAGFAPSRNALTVGETDIPAVRDGIRQLLEGSAGGTQAVRIVLEREEGRRLRAETEPFGTKHLAKLVFWQRVRDTWRPVDDGLMVSADRLELIATTLERFVPWLGAAADRGTDGTHDALPHHVAHQWPNPGADWLSVEPGKVVFHPRGVRMTCAVQERDGSHLLTLHQWRREESLWVPNACSIDLDMVQLDGVLSRIRDIDSHSETSDLAPQQGAIHVQQRDGSVLAIEQVGDDGAARCTITVPLTDIGRLGRALLQGGSLLARSLSEGERAELDQQHDERSVVAEYEAEAPADEGTSDAPPPPAVPYTSIKDVILNTLATPTAPPRDHISPPPRTRREPEPYLDHEEMDTYEEEPEEPVEELEPFVELEPEYIPVQDIQLDRHRVHISVRPGADARLSLQWSGKSIVLPVSRLDELVSDLRDLYYNALRGHRGRPITVAIDPPVTISVLHHGTQLYFALTQETEGNGTHLSFPANEVPIFLDAARAALAALGGEGEG